MRVLIKQKLFSIGASFDIYDEWGVTKYTAKGGVLSSQYNLDIFDPNGVLVGQITRVVDLGITFELKLNNIVCGIIRKNLVAPLGDKYSIDVCGWVVKGNLMDWNYNVYREGQHVLKIHKELLSWGDTYVIDIRYINDEFMGIMLVLAIAMANKFD